MTDSRRPLNRAASVRARLLNLARGRNGEFQLVLSEFAIERLLYRLGTSAHADRFVLKGAMLFKLWPAGTGRATWDLCLLAGVLPPRVVGLAAEWFALRREELEQDWELARRKERLMKVAPLV